MADKTQPFRRSFAGSVGAGLGSVFTPGGKTYYILEHKVSSSYHKAGENQEIIVDQIELGRDPKCQVRFDDNEQFRTVSRRHAAIVRDGENWKLIQLSQSNVTLLNGHPVKTEWYLQNGDEIQLSVNGPKLGFIIPSGNKSTVGSIGLSRRLSLFRQQALRPYKTALTVLGCVILVLALGGGYVVYDQHKKNEELVAKYAKASEDIRRQDMENDSLARKLVKSGESIAQLEAQLGELHSKGGFQGTGGTVRPTNNKELSECDPYIYYIHVLGFVVTLPSGEQGELAVGDEVGEMTIGGWSGTGFMLNNGVFVTARHVAQSWYYPISGGEADPQDMLFNKIVSNGGSVVAYFEAISSSGATLQFTSDDFVVNTSGDKVYDDDGDNVVIADFATDYAYMRTGKRAGLKFDGAASEKLVRGTSLTVLGFPFGLGANSRNDINPIYGSAVVAANGLQSGRIITTDTNYEHGNSGGPVFIRNGNELIVIGIVSATRGNQTGFIVPISHIK